MPQLKKRAGQQLQTQKEIFIVQFLARSMDSIAQPTAYKPNIHISIYIPQKTNVLGVSFTCGTMANWQHVTNKSKLNDDKTEFLLIISPFVKLTGDVQISIGQDQISPSSSCKSLGVMFDQHLSMDTQVKSICRSAHFHIGNINAIGLRHLLTPTASAQIVHSLVTSRLDY